MPVLKNERHERFAQQLATGISKYRAYREAGFAPSVGSAVRLSGTLKIRTRVDEICAERMAVAQQLAKLEELASDRALERLALSKEAIGREFLLVASSNIDNYLRRDRESGFVAFDLGKATREQMAAISEISIDYHKPSVREITAAIEGLIKDEKESEKAISFVLAMDISSVKRVRVKMHSKLLALEKLAQMFGMLKPDDKPPGWDEIEERIKNMTEEQRTEEAERLAELINQRLLETGYVEDVGIEAEEEEAPLNE